MKYIFPYFICPSFILHLVSHISVSYPFSAMPSALPSSLRVAIIGGGPGGLGTAIALSSLPDISVSIFEQARELREIGAGIQIGFNCWKVLELLGAAGDVKGNIKAQAHHRWVQPLPRCCLWDLNLVD
jgi:hypothetical protein